MCSGSRIEGRIWYLPDDRIRIRCFLRVGSDAYSWGWSGSGQPQPGSVIRSREPNLQIRLGKILLRRRSTKKSDELVNIQRSMWYLCLYLYSLSMEIAKAFNQNYYRKDNCKVGIFCVARKQKKSCYLVDLSIYLQIYAVFFIISLALSMGRTEAFNPNPIREEILSSAWKMLIPGLRIRMDLIRIRPANKNRIRIRPSREKKSFTVSFRYVSQNN